MRFSMAMAACSVLALMGACTRYPQPRTFPPQRTETRLACELRAPAEVKAGEPVPLTFALRNLTDEPIRFQIILTPFDGWIGNILRVTRDGEKVEYHGVMAIREEYPPFSYFAVGDHAELSVTRDVTTAYPMNAPGHYVIAFHGELLDAYAVREERGHRSAAVFMPCTQVVVDVR
jgi:peptidyl-Lys metalloendopeptidase